MKNIYTFKQKNIYTFEQSQIVSFKASYNFAQEWIGLSCALTSILGIFAQRPK